MIYSFVRPRSECFGCLRDYDLRLILFSFTVKGHRKLTFFGYFPALCSQIHSLREPTKKMSKSDSSPGSAILLTDSPDTIRTKIRRSQTDSLPGVTYDSANRPGVSNLIRTLAAIEVSCTEAVFNCNTITRLRILYLCCICHVRQNNNKCFDVKSKL